MSSLWWPVLLIVGVIGCLLTVKLVHARQDRTKAENEAIEQERAAIRAGWREWKG